MNLVYDVCHNIAKFEEHTVGGKQQEGLGPPQGGDAGLPAGPSRGPADVPQDRPAGDHPRRHGPGELGAGRPAGQHGADVRHDLPRRRPGDEPHAAVKDAAGRRIDKELEASGVIAGAQSRKGSGGGAAQGLQERR